MVRGMVSVQNVVFSTIGNDSISPPDQLASSHWS